MEEQSPQFSPIGLDKAKKKSQMLVAIAFIATLCAFVYLLLQSHLPSNVLQNVPRSYAPSKRELEMIQSILRKRSETFRISDFTEQPVRKDGKISSLFLSFTLLSTIRDNVIIGTWLTQKNSSYVFSINHSVSRNEYELLPHVPVQVQYEVGLNQDALRPRFRDGSFVLNVEVSSGKIGFLTYSGDSGAVASSNAEVIKNCSLEILGSEDGKYYCPTYVYQQLETRSYLLSDFMANPEN